jgi:hypothetical protein
LPHLACAQAEKGVLGQRREFARLIGQDVLRGGAGEQRFGEAGRNVVAQAGEDHAHLLDEPRRRAFLLSTREPLNRHGFGLVRTFYSANHQL